jgi:uncharacterized protein DUF4242
VPKYVIQRMFEVGEDRMPEIGRRSRRLIEEQFPDVTWLHSHVTVDENGLVRMFCIYEAPDEDAIRQHSRVLGYHFIDGVFEIAGDVTPEDFPLTEEPV